MGVDDHVGHAALVLHQDEHESLGGLRPLAGHDHPHHFEDLAVLLLRQAVAANRAGWQRAGKQRKRMAAGGEAQHGVLGEELLAGVHAAKPERLVRMVER